MRTRTLPSVIAILALILAGLAAGCKSEETAENSPPANTAPPSAPAVTNAPAATNTIAGGKSGTTSATAAGATAAPAAGSAAGNAASAKASEQAKPGKHPVVEFDTTMGKIKIQLDPEKAPVST